MFGLIAIGVLLTVVLLITALYGLFFQSRTNTKFRLEKYTSDDKNIFINTPDIATGIKKDSIFKMLGRLGKIMPFTNSNLEKLKKKLMQAAILMKPEEFIGVSLTSAAAVSFLTYLITKSIFFSLIFLIAGYLIPNLIIRNIKLKRMSKINSSIPQTLNIISNGLRAGFSFTQALDVVIKETSGPICDEFTKVLRDNSLGKPFEDALTNMSSRTDDEDLDIIITALVIQRQVGGNLAEILDTISETIRERVKIKGEINTLTAQGKISAVIISLLPFIIAGLLYLINPGYLSVLFTTLIGKIMIFAAILMQAAGIFIMTKLIDIKV